MTEQSAASTIAGYVVRSLGIAVLLILASFVSVLLKATDMSPALATWGTLALIYGMWKLEAAGPADTGVTAINDMRGQTGSNLLANYTSQQEYKLTQLREEHPSQEDDIGQDTDSSEEPIRAPSRKDDDARSAVCMAIAGVLVLALSWLAPQVWPR